MNSDTKQKCVWFPHFVCYAQHMFRLVLYSVDKRAWHSTYCTVREIYVACSPLYKAANSQTALVLVY